MTAIPCPPPGPTAFDAGAAFYVDHMSDLPKTGDEKIVVPLVPLPSMGDNDISVGFIVRA